MQTRHSPSASASPPRSRSHHRAAVHVAASAVDVDRMSYEELWALSEQIGDVVPRHPQATESQLRSLPTCTFTRPAAAASASPVASAETSSSSGDAAQCAVCLADYESGDTLVTIPCFHRFHVDCLAPWLKNCARCPVCKDTVFP
jgi:hypothetical protein